MARTPQQIYDEMVFIKDLRPELAAFNNPSQTARWRLWTYVIAFILHLHERIWDGILAEITDAARRNLAGTPLWYAERVKEFQFGYQLTIVDGEAVYETIDANAQIVKRVAVNNTGTPGLIQIKVAKISNEQPTPLDATELLALISYIENYLAFAGTNIAWVNAPADSLAVIAEIVYDAQVPQTQLDTDVKAAIRSYLANLSFDGLFYVERLTDAIQAVTGVVDVKINDLQITDYLGAIMLNPQSHRFTAGYATADGITLTFIPLSQ